MILFLLWVGLLAGWADREGRELIGTPAQPWRVNNWIHSEPLQLEELRGEVVLVRWWTAPSCPFCVATAPALNEFHSLYRERGLTVIGFYHHKSRSPLDPAQVKQYARNLGFQFPVAVDPEWQTLRRWWLQGGRRDFTSVSFLIDRRGVIRYVHPGGQYAPGDADYDVLRSKIEKLLEESP